MTAIADSYLAALREELARTTDPQKAAELQAEIDRLAPAANRRSVPAARTR